jgi:hypothetical protein
MENARMSRARLSKVVATGFLLVLALGLIVACNKGEGGAHVPSGAGVTQEDATATAVAEQRQIMGESLHGYPIKEYSSFEEAEHEAGYHIPRSSEYPLAFGKTTLQWFPQFERPNSETQYVFPPVGDTPISVGVHVLPSYFYPEGDKTATSGKPATVGGKNGWLDDGETAWIFVFDCGTVDGVKVWCQVMAVKEIGWDAFDHFVSTLQ